MDLIRKCRTSFPWNRKDRLAAEHSRPISAREDFRSFPRGTQSRFSHILSAFLTDNTSIPKRKIEILPNWEPWLLTESLEKLLVISLCLLNIGSVIAYRACSCGTFQEGFWKVVDLALIGINLNSFNDLLENAGARSLGKFNAVKLFHLTLR